MRSRDRRLAVLVALAGIGFCCAALLHFLLAIVNNGLPWKPDQSVRDHYLAVGNSYAQGFIVGFFLCFFLSLAAVALATWVAADRGALAGTHLVPHADAELSPRVELRRAEHGSLQLGQSGRPTPFRRGQA